MSRAIATGAMFAVSAVIGLVTSLVTADKSTALWVGLGVLIVGGAGLQAWLIMAERRSAGRRVSASGAGSVAIGGSAREVRTRVRGMRHAAPDGTDDAPALGPGAVSIQGDAGFVATDVDGGEGRPQT